MALFVCVKSDFEFFFQKLSGVVLCFFGYHVSMAQENRVVSLPEEIITAYQTAKDTYIKSEERHRQWARNTLEDFMDALRSVVESVKSSHPETQRSRRREALEYLLHIYKKEVVPKESSTDSPEGAV